MHYKPNQTRSTHSSDISRLLDPTYSTPHQTSDSNLHSVYVDGAGQIHDPDYHAFPSMSHIHHPHNKHKKNQENRLAWELEAAALDGEDEHDNLQVPRRLSLSSSDYAYSTPNSPAFPSTPSLVDDVESLDQDHDWSLRRTVSHHDGHSAKTALRKQWMALSLRVRFKVFRAKQRLTESRSH